MPLARSNLISITVAARDGTNMTHLYQDAIDLFGVQFLPLNWIERIRRQPKLAERVLAEVKMLKQEGRITKSPAAA